MVVAKKILIKYGCNDDHIEIIKMKKQIELLNKLGKCLKIKFYNLCL